MNEDQRKSIETDYPGLSANARFECGWYDILRDMFAEVHGYIVLHDDIDPKFASFSQIKEKFGTLRAHFDLGPDDQDRDDINFLRHWKRIHDIIKKYEQRSATMCEDCCAGGEIRPCGWLRTLCDTCYHTWKNRRI